MPASRIFKLLLLTLLLSLVAFPHFSASTVLAQPEPDAFAEAQNSGKTSLITLSYSFARPKMEQGLKQYDKEFKQLVQKFEQLGFKGAAIPAIAGLDTYNIPGEPVVPFKTCRILLPYQYEVADIKVTGGQKIKLGRFFIQPGQQPVHTDSPGDAKLTAPDATIYDSTTPYPKESFLKVATQWKRGYQVLVINLHPVEYIPKTGELSYFSDLSIAVSARQTSGPLNSLFRGLPGDRELIKTVADNPQEISTYDSAARPVTATPLSAYKYLIITSNTLQSAAAPNNFQALQSHKNGRGVTTQIATVEAIYASVAGTDNQDKIRNYIRQEYLSSGIEYVLLGGDADGADEGGESGNNIVPVRGLWSDFEDCSPPNIPSDLYYACLDDTFDSNGNGIYGESTDGSGGGEVDLMAEVYVGRAPVDSEEEMRNFVRKTIAYEQASGDAYLDKIWMVGEQLDSNPTWGGDYKDEIKSTPCSACGYSTSGVPNNCTKNSLYDRDYAGNNWPKSELINIINSDVHIINHLGHSNVGYVMKMVNADIDAFANSKYFFGYSQGCYAGAFDNRDNYCKFLNYDCAAEHMVTGAHGAFAFIANSRYGWYSPGGTCGPSQYFDRQFWDAVYGEGITNIGRANQDSKEDNIGQISSLRYVYYELTLFGDPETQLWPCSGTPPPPLGYTESLVSHEFIGAGVAQGWYADDYSWQYSLPFAFRFYDNVYDTVWVCSNGFLDFTNSGYSWANSSSALTTRAMIAPLWDDLRTDGTGEDIYIHQPDADSVCIRWKGHLYNNGAPVNLETILYRDGRIKFNYGDGNTDLTPTVGISRGDSSNYDLSTYNDNSILTNVSSNLFTPLGGGNSDEIGVWRGSTRYFYLDTNGDGKYTNPATERFGTFLTATQANDRPVAGDWDGDGSDEIGVWRGSTRYFYLDTNGDGKYTNPATERFGTFLTSYVSGDMPVAGDWDGDGSDEIGIWRSSTRYFYLDTNGDGKYTNPATERFGPFLNTIDSSDRPVAGDWDGDGSDEIGVWRGATRYFYLDTNSDGKYTNPATERFGPFLSATQANDRPVAGDWDGDGSDEIGVWRGSTRYFYLDTNGDGKYTSAATERFGPFLSATQANDMPVAGDWDGL